MADYHNEISEETAAFCERIAADLRRPERLDASFDLRLMEKVRAEAGLPANKGATHSSWWRTERVLRVSPLAGLALAAGISMFVAVSTLAIGSRVWSRGTRPVAAATLVRTRTDTVNVVRFVFADPGARSVQLVGDFNEWTRGATNLKPSGAPGVWSVSVPLHPGRHEYAFIVNGTRWIADPLATKSSDDFGTESSVIHVGQSSQSSS
jgi:Glycogen recognition site of AMP-activated protein kinase